VNGQVALLPASVAVAVTVVWPRGKKEPGSWSQLAVGVLQLSVAVRGVKLTSAPTPAAVPVATAVAPVGGQLVKIGCSASGHSLRCW
jgi:hypothetical protein